MGVFEPVGGASYCFGQEYGVSDAGVRRVARHVICLVVMRRNVFCSNTVL